MESVLSVFAIFGSIFTVGLGVGSSSKNTRVEQPSVPLPSMISALISQTAKDNYVGPIPWQKDVQRNDLVCKREALCSDSRAYIITLPSTTTNTWYLSTLDTFSTHYYKKYPVATVVRIPGNATGKFILDSKYLTYGILPTIDEQDNFFPLSPAGNGRNVTGNFAHSFVIINESGNDVHFSKTAFDDAIKEKTVINYWLLKPGSFTLMWPGQKYYNNHLSERTWNASMLPKPLSHDFCAYLAENMMFNYLAPQAPLGSD
jgi:hypothetical protein